MIDYTQWPDRIRQKFTDLQYQSELIVAVVQLAILLLFSIIIICAPAGYTPEAPIHSALLGLSLFTLLVLVRLWFAYQRQLSGAMLGFFVVSEMILLLFIIWTYSVEFETTPTINLKNSHINYIFVLIALRALRFEPLWVILSGFTAVLGWAMIVWHALDLASAQAISWDYVTYASARSIYLGAEFDKILCISLVTLIITFALRRAQNTLRQAVDQTFAVKDLSMFFDDAVVEKITRAEMALTAGQGEQRDAVIVFIDMRGFSKLSEKVTSQVLLRLLGEYQRLIVPIIQKHNGSIDKFMGDGILASFGAVIPSDTYAADALHAVDDIFAAVVEWKKQREQKGEEGVDVGMGLAVGEVLFGLIGHDNRLEYTVIGETVNLAAKLEKHNKVEEVNALATYEVLKKAQQQGYSLSAKEIRRGCHVSGIEDKLDLVVLG